MKMIFTGKVSGEKTVLTVGGRHTVKAQPGEQYGLIDEVTGLVPDGVEADRSGDDLILRKKEEDTEVRIEGFWEECQPGETQCTAVFNIVGEDGQVTEAVLTQDGPVLDDITAGQSGTLSDDDRGGFIWLGGLAFGGGLAAMALAAGGGGSKHRHENDDSDTTAPSSPALKAEDDGSVSVELPGDANKGDTVDVTFEDEKGGKHTVTLEKGDNGWTSSDPTLIPDSTGDKATIPADNVKDNSEVTGVAKDPSGNESDPSTVTSKTDGVADAPVLSIPEVTDGYANADELKDGLQAEVTLPAGTAEGAVITLTVTRPDKTTENVTHTVTKDEVAAGKVSMDIPKDAVIDGQNSVSVTLTQGSNPAKPGNVVDFAADTQIPGDTDGDGATDATPVVAIPEAADGVNAEELKDGVQTEVTVPKGSAAGDTLTLTVTKPDGTTDTVEHTLTADEVAAGKADVTIPADKVTADGQYSVTAEITDPAGNTSGQGQPADFAVDTVAPSAPVLKAEDDGSVSVELPGDANKGDTVDVTFEDEKGGKHTVTLEKGDNGWTSSDPTLIPDSTGDKATIPADNVKDNSEVTGVAKDPSGNESDPSTVTSKTDVLPTVSISVETTSTDVNGDGFTGIASVNGTVMDVPATIEDKDDSTGLVYTVSLNHVTTTDVTVTVTLGSGAGHSDAADYSDIGGAQHNGKIGLHGDTGKVTYDGATTVTIVIPAGSKSVSFIVDPTLEANQDAFNAEGMEKVVATITGTSDNVTAATDIVDNAGASATGVIYDGNAISLRNLDGDFTLKYSL
ncbi:RTX toxin, partial [Escherichia coli]|nr:RTX toxin [Escherichia coli]HBL7970298.1 RTX toxin [Escherichia coli]